MKNTKILLGVTGGIAAYKAIDLASRLIKAGAEVKTILTKNSQKFVTPDVFRAITRNQVETEAFNLDEPIAHIDMADWADMLVVAPATANIIGKLAGGIGDDLLSTTVLAMHKPRLVVPAMNVHMYANSIVQENLEKLRRHGWMILEPDTGRLACGYEGKGRFPDVEEVLFAIRCYLEHGRDMVGKRVLVTAGACREHLDDMRFLTNHSSGLMGLALARAAFLRGADVRLIHAHIDYKVPYDIDAIRAETAQQMYDACHNAFEECDILFMASAVTDYTFAERVEGKMKKADDLNLPMKRTKDVLKSLGEIKRTGQTLIGFAAESEDVVENARKKLELKRLDYVAGNLIKVSGQKESLVHFVSKDNVIEISGDKFDIANRMLDIVACGKETV